MPVAVLNDGLQIIDPMFQIIDVRGDCVPMFNIRRTVFESKPVGLHRIESRAHFRNLPL